MGAGFICRENTESPFGLAVLSDYHKCMASQSGNGDNVISFPQSTVTDDTVAAVRRLRRAVAAMDENVNAVVTATADLQDKLSTIDKRLNGVADELKAANRSYDKALARLSTLQR